MQTETMKPDEASQFRILTEISQQITSVLDIDELLAQVVRLIQRTFNYYHVGIGLIEGDEVVYRVDILQEVSGRAVSPSLWVHTFLKQGNRSSTILLTPITLLRGEEDSTFMPS